MTGKNGFTLLEVLLTIAILAILSTIVVGGVDVVNKSARAKRNALTCKVLETAINRYKAEYNEWPVETSDGTEFKEDNYKVIEPLRENGQGNHDNIRFIDETTLYAVGDENRLVKLSETEVDSSASVVYIPKSKPKSGHKYMYYVITFDYDSGIVHVTAPDTSDISEDDKY